MAWPMSKGIHWLGLAILPAVALGGFTLWTLHHPSPRLRAPVPITRSALLPHRYAGPCLNCHYIQEMGPVAIDAGTMDRLPLTPVERRLVLAGQRVEVPSISQRVAIPAITRTDDLPHPYVGVCSNCHVVLDVHPSPEFMQAAMRRAGQPLVALNLPAEATARGGDVPDDRRAAYRRAWGYAALPLLVVTIAAITGRVAARKRVDSQVPPLSATGWLRLHEIAAVAFCVVTTLHWYYSDRGNNFLHLALVTLCWLGSAGLVMRYQLADARPPGRVYLRHTQWFALLGFSALLVLGHFFGHFD